MRLRQGVDYRLIAGHRLNPFGRQYETLRAIDAGPVTVPAGYRWDGMTMVPQRHDPPMMRGVLAHDRLYQRRIGSPSTADRAMNAVWREDGIPWAHRWIILVALLWMRPTAWAYWHTSGGKLKLLPIAGINAGAMPGLIFALM